jgi:signal transduction histidine kinase
VVIREDTEGVTLRVRDQGDGVPDEDRDRIFEPFYRASGHRDEDDLGAGLGLSIVREIARAHGGDVTLEAPDPDRRGATFSVRLPRA